MTAYRQEALRCVARLEHGPAVVRILRVDADAPHAGRIVRSNVYGWFERVSRGTYALSPQGRRALADNRADVRPWEGDPTHEEDQHADPKRTTDHEGRT
jgi:hypothetical protein